ncbi:MAG: hypothetical protein KU38_03965 [Sulfurovum sp. FS08-3]|nr:MAG: hypothetical protein KU38_03965 [Sulfurovum sp. FS08-3]
MNEIQNILIVDDEKSNIDILLNFFSINPNPYYKFIVALSGEKALQIVETREVDLILLDIVMPHMDGYEVCRRLKANPQTQHIPILFITSSTDEASILKAYELGAVDYVTKPFRAIELMARVKINLELQSSFRQLKFLYGNLQDSIAYASHIQNAIIPQPHILESFFAQHFVMWQPKDTVGGDIYLFEELRHSDEALLMVIDCTGHGVPGAFVTMLVKAIEREIIGKIITSNEAVNPAHILQHFNRIMKKLLKKEDYTTRSDSGFDGGILYINKKEKILRFAGANTPFVYLQEGHLKIIKGDRHSVGYRKSQDDYPFTNHTLEYSSKICGYLATDGYFDQTGGEYGFMLGRKNFLKLIKEHYTQNMNDQKKLFEENLTNYQGTHNRKDDITLIGFRI